MIFIDTDIIPLLYMDSYSQNPVETDTERGHRKCPYEMGWIYRKSKDFLPPGTKKTICNN